MMHLFSQKNINTDKEWNSIIINGIFVEGDMSAYCALFFDELNLEEEAVTIYPNKVVIKI